MGAQETDTFEQGCADMTETSELLTALWPVLASIVAGFAVGVYVWANTKRDTKDALTAAKAAIAEAGKIAALELAFQRELAALESRIAVFETRQADILEALRYIKDNMLLKHRNRSLGREE